MLPRPPSPNPPYPYNPNSSAHYDRKQKQRSIMGITAGAEDVKYQAKYKELKKKVKEIESVSHHDSKGPGLRFTMLADPPTCYRTMTGCTSSCYWPRRIFVG